MNKEATGTPMQEQPEDLYQSVLKHYNEISDKARSRMRIIPDALRWYFLEKPKLDRELEAAKAEVGKPVAIPADHCSLFVHYTSECAQQAQCLYTKPPRAEAVEFYSAEMTAAMETIKWQAVELKAAEQERDALKVELADASAKWLSGYDEALNQFCMALDSAIADGAPLGSNPPIIATYAERLRAAEQRMERLEERYDEFFQQIDSWAKAYPTDVFPEVPKEIWPVIQKVLEDNGCSLDRVSASNMRHVVTRIKEAADAARSLLTKDEARNGPSATV